MSEKMNTGTTIVTLPQMVDLALSTPEAGIINFSLLHALLHVMVKQLNLHDCNVEFRGSESERLQNYIANTRAGPLIALSEYTIGSDSKGKKRRLSERSASLKSKEIAVIPKDDATKSSKKASESLQKVVVVETVSNERLAETPQFAVAITRKELAKLHQDIKELQEKVKELIELPSNTGLFTAIRSSKDGSNSPLLDMFQILALVKRMDAAELSVNKLASIVQDLVQEQANNLGSSQQETQQQQEKLETLPVVNELISRTSELRKSLDNTVNETVRIQELTAQINGLEERVTKLERSGIKKSSVGLFQSSAGSANQRSSSKMLQGRTVGKTSVSVVIGEENTSTTPRASIASETKSNEAEEIEYREINFIDGDLSVVDPREAILILQKELLDLKEAFSSNATAFEMSKGSGENLISLAKFGQLDSEIKDTKEQMATMNTISNQRFSSIESQINELSDEIAAAWEQIKASAGASSNENESIYELSNKFVELQQAMSNLDDAAKKLREESEVRENSLSILTDQIELLKTIKADKEDLEDALADKADACQLYRKVSREQFDTAYNEITKAVDYNLDKINKQEEYWAGALTDQQKDIERKVDKTELQPLKDFINSKLKIIQEKIRKIADMKKECEAAGTKSKYLKDVNCISCDADVVMKKDTDITLYPKPYAMQPSKGAGPYLAYELDQLRKQQKSLASHNKNLYLLENALQFGKIKTGPKDHLCTRYCGGSHTVTTAQQRVMRAGHFLEQWGPEIIPVNEILIKGTDGRFYKGHGEITLTTLIEGKQSLPNQSATIIVENGKDIKASRSEAVRERPQTASVVLNGDRTSLQRNGEMKSRTRSNIETIIQRSKSDTKANLSRKSFQENSKTKTSTEKISKEQENSNGNKNMTVSSNAVLPENDVKSKTESNTDKVSQDENVNRTSIQEDRKKSIVNDSENGPQQNNIERKTESKIDNVIGNRDDNLKSISAEKEKRESIVNDPGNENPPEAKESIQEANK